MPKAAELHPLTKVQRFEPRRVNRSDLKNAKYNPRQIDANARRKLERKLRKKGPDGGLLEPLIWNEKTGNLVGGHQRLAIIDMIEGSANYSLDVAVVRMNHKQEVESNIFLNNPSVQGTWDLIAMSELLKEDDISIDEMGFEPMDIEVLFDEGDLFGTRPDEEEAGVTIEPPAVRPSAADEDIRQRQETLRRHGKEDDDEAKARIRSDRNESRARAQEKDDTEFYVVVVFMNREERESFMTNMNHTENEKYLDGRELCSRLGINIGR
jgi:hypothetical protein